MCDGASRVNGHIMCQVNIDEIMTLCISNNYFLPLTFLID